MPKHGPTLGEGMLTKPAWGGVQPTSTLLLGVCFVEMRESSVAHKMILHAILRRAIARFAEFARAGVLGYAKLKLFCI